MGQNVATCEVVLLLPEWIATRVPKYKRLIDAALEAASDDDDDEAEQTVEIVDTATYDLAAFKTAMKLLVEDPLPKIGGTAEDHQAILHQLLQVNDVIVSLEPVSIQKEILSHIEGSVMDLEMGAFFSFARAAYADETYDRQTRCATDSPIGKLIKRKLAAMLPEVLSDGTAERIKDGGGALSTEFLGVMIGHAHKERPKEEL